MDGISGQFAHGRRARYIGGCRCQLCTAANRNYARKRGQARREGDWNGIVSADQARAHLRWLSEQGIGRRSVAAATDIADAMLSRIRSGKKARIRALTARLILAVTPAMASDHSRVERGETFDLIEQLCAEGFTKVELARQLGYRGRGLRFNGRRMTARNVARVAALHKRWTT